MDGGTENVRLVSLICLEYFTFEGLIIISKTDTAPKITIINLKILKNNRNFVDITFISVDF